jgi:AraC-like DNA-binding protein
MAENRRLSNLGVLGLVVRDQPTLRSALDALVHHVHLHNEAMTVTVEESDGLVTIQQEMTRIGGSLARQATEMSMTTTFRILSVFLGHGWRPKLVCFVHRAPPNTAPHRRVFGETVKFGQAFNGIVCRAADLEAPNPGADAVMARYANRLLELAPGKAAPMAERVRQLIVLLLPRGRCRAEVVAQHLGVDRRTVTNQLAVDGATFSSLVDGIRKDLLSRYLKDGTRPLSEISALLGFSAPTAFARWHRKQFGETARKLKEARRGDLQAKRSWSAS